MVETVRALGAASVVKLAFEFLVLTVARSGEVRGAEWAEIDTEDHVWTVPETRTPDRAMSLNRLRRGLGNTSAFPLLNVCAASRICWARRVRGALMYKAARQRGDDPDGLSYVHAVRVIRRHHHARCRSPLDAESSPADKCSTTSSMNVPCRVATGARRSVPSTLPSMMRSSPLRTARRSRRPPGSSSSDAR